MNRKWPCMVISLLLSAVMSTGCGGGGGGGGGASSDKAITAFGFTSPAASGTVNESAKTISVTVPYRTDTTTLAATFTTTGSDVFVGGTKQVSGVTKNNFSTPVVYSVNAADGSSQNYTVTVTLAFNGAVVLGTPITTTDPLPITSFGQSLASHDSGTLNNIDGYYQEIFPGQANVWDIDYNFTLADGGDFQFAYALLLSFTDTSSFGAQTYADLTFYGPTMGTAQGVKVAAVSDGVSTGVFPLGSPTFKYSAFLNSTSDSRLMQTLLTSGATGTITFTWNDRVNLNEGMFAGYLPSYSVVVRDVVSGDVIKELYSWTTTTNTTSWMSNTAYLSPTDYNGQDVVLSFEERSMPGVGFANPNLTMIDNVSAKDSASVPVEYVKNGDFESGDLTNWTTNTPVEVQNMTSGGVGVEPTHDDLDVTRSFYTVPNKLWGRWVDVFENNTASAITTTVYYNTQLGSTGTEITSFTPSTNQQAMSAWDNSKTTRDIGMVFGTANNPTYDGTDMIDFSYNITVPPAGRVAIVNFIILGTYDTSLTAVDTSARATEIDSEAQKIVNNFWTDPTYRDGMTQSQLDALKNF